MAKKKTGVDFLDFFDDPQLVGDLRDLLDERSFNEFEAVYNQVSDSYLGAKRVNKGNLGNLFGNVLIGGAIFSNGSHFRNDPSDILRPLDTTFNNTLFDNAKDFRTGKNSNSGGLFGLFLGETTTRFSYDQGGVFDQLQKARGNTNDLYKVRSAEANIARNL